MTTETLATSTPDEIRAAFAAREPLVAADFEDYARKAFDRLVARFGPSLRGIYNDRGGIAVMNAIGGSVRRSRNADGSKVAYLDEERLSALSAKYAAASLSALAEKTVAKLGELDEARISFSRGADFSLSGTREGRKVRIEQRRILNVSRNGVLFNQWPARIYLDGDATSERAYRAEFAG